MRLLLFCTVMALVFLHALASSDHALGMQKMNPSLHISSHHRDLSATVRAKRIMGSNETPRNISLFLVDALEYFLAVHAGTKNLNLKQERREPEHFLSVKSSLWRTIVNS